MDILRNVEMPLDYMRHETRWALVNLSNIDHRLLNRRLGLFSVNETKQIYTETTKVAGRVFSILNKLCETFTRAS